MTVYVDNAFIRADVPNGGRVVSGRWCHMMADSRSELDAMADRIGLRREWIQHPGTPKEHYDVTEPKRRAAVAAGAVERDWHEISRERLSQRRGDFVDIPSPPSQTMPVAKRTHRGSVMVPPRSFVAIDFETANPSRASVIQIGVTRVMDGVVGIPHTSAVRPPDGHRAWNPSQFKVHGLSPSYIVGAPEWPEVMARLVRIASLRDGTVLPLVAHNAAFERSVVNKTSEACGIVSPWEPDDYFDTVKYARQEAPNLPRHKLDFLVEHFELGEFQHHDAGEDARMTALLLLHLASAHIEA